MIRKWQSVINEHEKQGRNFTIASCAKTSTTLNSFLNERLLLI